jgi:hypothetical protein
MPDITLDAREVHSRKTLELPLFPAEHLLRNRVYALSSKPNFLCSSLRGAEARSFRLPAVRNP